MRCIEEYDYFNKVLYLKDSCYSLLLLICFPVGKFIGTIKRNPENVINSLNNNDCKVTLKGKYIFIVEILFKQVNE